MCQVKYLNGNIKPYFGMSDTKDSKIENFKFIKLGKDEKILFLNLLGYDIDNEEFIVSKDTKERVKCHYTNEFVNLKNASILPGSTIFINTSAYTLSSYISDYLTDEGESECQSMN